MTSKCPSLPPCETAPPLVERSVLRRRKQHLLEGHRSLVVSEVVALGLGRYLEELHEAVYLECWRRLCKPTASKNKYSSLRDTCMMVSVWEETDTVTGKQNILPKMASYGVRSLQWQICTELSQISHFLNVFLGVFVMIRNTTAEAVHRSFGFVNSKWFCWLGMEVSDYPALSIYFLPV